MEIVVIILSSVLLRINDSFEEAGLSTKDKFDLILILRTDGELSSNKS